MNTEPRILGRGVLLGLATGLLLSLIMVPAFLAGLPPMPQPPGLAFAEWVLGAPQPMPVGLAFHLAYVTLWAVVWVALDYPRLRLATAAALAAFLWIVALVVFFPLVGWGLLGLGVSPRLIPGAAVPHALFAIFLWALGRVLFARGRQCPGGGASADAG